MLLKTSRHVAPIPTQLILHPTKDVHRQTISKTSRQASPTSKPQVLHPRTSKNIPIIHQDPRYRRSTSRDVSNVTIFAWAVMFQVHLRSHLIMNGVCVRWRGWIDLERLDGVGCLEYDEEHAAEEDALLRDQLERYNQRLRDFEEKQRTYRGGPASAAQPPHLNHHYHHDTHHATSHHHHHHGHHSRHVGSTGATGATATGIEPHLPHRQDPEMEVRLRAY